MIVIETLLCAVTVLMLVPVAVLMLQVLAAWPQHRTRAMPPGRRPRIGVLVPAHNEALLIAAAVRAIKTQLAPGDRLLVVADNCNDETARLAAGAGAEVVERFDSTRRGKSYALDFGVRHFEREPPEFVLVLDADCEISGDSIDRIAILSLATSRPVQSLYRMQLPAAAGSKMRIVALAWLVKNYVRALGFHRLGLSCQLMGTGMIFPWPLISTATLASGHLAEDVKLGTELALAGAPVLFCPDATVTSWFPAGADGMASQRTRWEHGHLSAIRESVPRLLFASLRRGDLQLLALALDLAVPPLALLLLTVATILTVAAVFSLATGNVLPLELAVLELFVLGLSVFLAWQRYGRSIISLAGLACAPVYALRKIPLYVRFLIDRQVEWVRSRRDGE